MPTIARVIATWFGCGRSPVAPGTVGTLGALPLWFAVRGGGPKAVLVTAAAMTLIGVWAAGVFAAERGAKDPQEVVVDEVAGVLVALTAAPPSFAGTALAVVLFRVFDITKPFPTRHAEQLPGGWGIVLDDVVAGMQAALVLGGLRALEVLS
jgi:phosphatidylglycerophosphatase A